MLTLTAMVALTASCFPSAPRMPSVPWTMPIEVIISIMWDENGGGTYEDLESDSPGQV